jgi:CBS-domain-containing membrane protein
MSANQSNSDNQTSVVDNKTPVAESKTAVDSKSDSSSQKTSAVSITTLDEMLLYFTKVPIVNVRPRAISGRVRVWEIGQTMTVQAQERVTRAFYKLVTEDFLSCPVVDSNGHYVGMLDHMDLLRVIVDMFEESKLPPTESGWGDFFKHKFADVNCEYILKQRPKDAITPSPISTRYSILHAMEMFCLFGSPRRVPVLNDNHQLMGICTQSMICSLLCQFLDKIPAIKDLPVSAMFDEKSAVPAVLTVKESDTALDGFRLMLKQNIQGLAVVDNSGALVDELSVKDLRGIGTDAAKWKRIYWPVKRFKETVLLESDAFRRMGVKSVLVTDSFETLLKIMDDGNAHRVFVVEKSATPESRGKPVRVISQVDVIRFVLRKSGMQQHS